jgi:hypothetical protein
VGEANSCFVSEGLLVFNHNVLSILFFFPPYPKTPPVCLRRAHNCGGSGHSRELAICRDGSAPRASSPHVRHIVTNKFYCGLPTVIPSVRQLLSDNCLIATH